MLTNHPFSSIDNKCNKDHDNIINVYGFLLEVDHWQLLPKCEVVNKIRQKTWL